MPSNPNLIKIHWEFDVETDEEIQSKIGMSGAEVENILQINDELEVDQLNRLCCHHLDVPVWVDLDLFFEDPRGVDDYQITDALSDEYGWLIKSWKWQDDA